MEVEHVAVLAAHMLVDVVPVDHEDYCAAKAQGVLERRALLEVLAHDELEISIRSAGPNSVVEYEMRREFVCFV